MPEHYPDFPNHQLVLEYLRSYAQHFGLYEHITFNTSVEKVEPLDKLWDVTLNNGQVSQYRGVIIANGHHKKPKYPNFPGSFNGAILHSRDYKTPEQLSNKRVLIVGGGQSALDIVAESAVVAQETFHSTRRKFVCLKKYFLGKPTEQFLQELPGIKYLSTQTVLKLVSRLSPSLLKLEGIDVKKWGIPWGGEQEIIYPIVDDKIYQYYSHGRLKSKPNITELQGNKVLFEDNSLEDIDVIIYATGYHLSVPFLEKKFLNWEEQSIPNLFLYMFSPQYENLFTIGMVNPLGAHWTVYETQSELLSLYLKAKNKNMPQAREFDKIRLSFKPEDSHPFNAFKNPEKYPLIVDKMLYSKALNKYIKQLAN
jgi:cation diffusion facilitator CzcD-associated flavoprotein CzcO